MLGASQTGKTLTAALKTSLGAPAAGMTTTSLLETSTRGNYFLDAQVPNGHFGYIQVLDGAIEVGILEVNPLTTEGVTNTGGGDHSVTITIQRSDTSAPIVGQSVTVKNSAETQTIAWGTTNASGQVEFKLSAGTYKILVGSSATYQTLATQTLTVSGTTTQTYSLVPTSLLSPSAANKAVVYGDLVLLTGAPAANVDVEFTMSLRKGAENGTLLVTVGEPVVVTTNAAGRFQTELIRTDLMTKHDSDDTIVYRMRCRECNIDDCITITASPTEISTKLPGI